MTKKQLRYQYLAQRMALTMPEMHQKLAMMLEHFEQLPFNNIAYVLSYLPITQRHEPTPQYFEEALREHSPTYQLCFPQANFENYQMQAIADDETMEITTNEMGITQPLNGNIIPNHAIDLIFVPLAAVDSKGYRVGYGKGFYDRYIPLCRPNIVTIGLSFFEPVSQISDANQFDVPLKYCITPQQLYEF